MFWPIFFLDQLKSFTDDFEALLKQIKKKETLAKFSMQQARWALLTSFQLYHSFALSNTPKQLLEQQYIISRQIWS